MSSVNVPIKRKSDGKIGQFIKQIEKEDIQASAQELLLMTVDDLEPYREEFNLYLMLSIGELCTGTGLSKKEVEQVLDINPSTSYRYLNEGVLAPMIQHASPQRGNRYYDGRHHLFSLTAPSQNPDLDDENKKRIQNLEQSITAILKSRRLLGSFLATIGRGLEDADVMNEVLDMLLWFYQRLHESYQSLLGLSFFQERAGMRHNRVISMLWTMKLLFGQGRESPVGRFVLEGYLKYWQMLPGAQPPLFEGKEDVNRFLNTLKRPFISRTKE